MISKKILLMGVVITLSGCSLTPPKPPSCSESNAGLKPINPRMISEEQLKLVLKSIQVTETTSLERVSQ